MVSCGVLRCIVRPGDEGKQYVPVVGAIVAVIPKEVLESFVVALDVAVFSGIVGRGVMKVDAHHRGQVVVNQSEKFFGVVLLEDLWAAMFGVNVVDQCVGDG